MFLSSFDKNNVQTRILNLDYDLKKLQNLPWVTSDFGKEQKRIIDLNIRNSVECYCQISETNTTTRFSSPNCWKVLKYENGFFKQHVDHQVNPKHRGIEILLPPADQCPYQGGDLVIFEKQEQKSIRPNQNNWTWIYLPLGTIHEVKEVIGIRISFVRVVNGKEDYKYDRQSEAIKAIAIEN